MSLVKIYLIHNVTIVEGDRYGYKIYLIIWV